MQILQYMNISATTAPRPQPGATNPAPPAAPAPSAATEAPDAATVGDRRVDAEDEKEPEGYGFGV